MEPCEKEELIEARRNLKRQLEILACGSRPAALIAKLRSLMAEIDELLEGGRPDSPQPSAVALREGAVLYEIHGEPLSRQLIKVG